MTINAFISKANLWGKNKIPFLFLIDFEMEKPLIYLIDEAQENGLWFNIKGHSNCKNNEVLPFTKYEASPIKYDTYKFAFNKVQQALQRGDTYLLNLTFPSVLKGKLHFETIFKAAQAPYKLLKQNDFVLYSPECFIRISNNMIYSFPMKGTINANIENAEQKLLSNTKELFEHNTIVDLIRNDLAMVANRITVNRFRYVDSVCRPHGNLLQVSSEISGQLNNNWQNYIGEILVKLLPAGSVCGAPKQKTCEIIHDTEKEKRGYYTGIFGIFDGESLDSAVNIRYIEQYNDGTYRYRSGGGITALSNCEEEYGELIEKVYVPIIRKHTDK